MEHQHEEQTEAMYAAENSVVNALGSPLPQSSPLKPGPQGSFGSDTGSIVGYNEQLEAAEEGHTGAYGEELPGAAQDQLFADGEQDNEFHTPSLTVIKRCDQPAQVGFSESSSTALIISEAHSNDQKKVAGSLLCWVHADAHGPNSQSQYKVIFV